uniref:Uncharacterized protein n=1 Tax=Rhizophora mucronata TaxID=61149 RepID=A0A2P2N1B5_RHIMU
MEMVLQTTSFSTLMKTCSSTLVLCLFAN